MARSPGFGSGPGNSVRPLQTCFRCAYAYRLKLAAETNSLTHYTKGTPSFQKTDSRNQTSQILCSDFCFLSSETPTACRHPVSGTVSLPSSGCFSPFPHGTGALSVTEEYLGLEGGPPIFRQDCSCPALLEDPCAGFPYGAVTRSGPPFQALPVPNAKAIGLFRFRSPLLAESRLMSVPPATEMFQFAGFASPSYEFRRRYPRELPLAGGLPHSEIPGSPIARISPGLFAACRVLHRLSVPRHPPDALHSRSIQQHHPSPPRGTRPAPPNPAAHSGQPQTGPQRELPKGTLPSGNSDENLPTRHRARSRGLRISHEDTSLGRRPRRRLPPSGQPPRSGQNQHPRPVRLGHFFTNPLHPSINTVRRPPDPEPQRRTNPLLPRTSDP